MTKPKNPIELSYEDLLSGVVTGEAPQVEGEPSISTTGVETGSDFLSTINNMIERANAFITNVKDIVSLMRSSGMPLPAGGPVQNQNQIYQPQLTLQQQLQRIVNIAYAAYGNITIAELLQRLVQQYGGVKLSEVIKALEKQQ